MGRKIGAGEKSGDCFDALRLAVVKVNGKKLCGLDTWQAEKQYICRKLLT